MGWLTLLTGTDDSVADHPFSRATVGQYHTLTAAPDEQGMDAQTARDMLLDEYADRLGTGTSLCGRQALHRRLHGVTPAAPERVRALLAAPDLLAQAVQACRPLRRAEADVVPALFGAPLAPAPGWARWLSLLPVAWLASVALAFFIPLGWVAAVALTFVLVALQAAWHERTQEWDSVLLPLRSLLDVHQALGSLADTSGVLAPFVPAAVQAGKLRRLFALSIADSIPGQREYRDWLLQANVKRYFASRAAVVRHLAFLRSSYRLVAELEADCALARHLQATPFCWAQSSDGRAVGLRAVVHPLLARPAPVDFALVDGPVRSSPARTVSARVRCCVRSASTWSRRARSGSATPRRPACPRCRCTPACRARTRWTAAKAYIWRSCAGHANCWRWPGAARPCSSSTRFSAAPTTWNRCRPRRRCCTSWLATTWCWCRRTTWSWRPCCATGCGRSAWRQARTASPSARACCARPTASACWPTAVLQRTSNAMR
ncbi:hypothetical protein PX653_24185 [Pseudoduganella chitinolytica]|uniref:DUF2868 domain-containing protein n=1 Tax=Pseudoduganella chitinolytica TaxID=34070 RepID=A0ABY8B971_9BURK|nr:hypothetical protein [Pseudoduganella chitinolytica]WEF32476.1 hypothetical protein PX653_24185 [Pseudoduganella chitinolytica]